MASCRRPDRADCRLNQLNERHNSMMGIPIRLRRAEYEFTKYVEVVPAGVSLEAAMASDYWAHVHRGLRLYDEIVLIAADGYFDATVRVIAIDSRAGTIRFRVLNLVGAEGKPISGGAIAMESPFELKHRGHGKWSVLERSSGKVLIDGVSKDEAAAFAETENSKAA